MTRNRNLISLLILSTFFVAIGICAVGCRILTPTPLPPTVAFLPPTITPPPSVTPTPTEQTPTLTLTFTPTVANTATHTPIPPMTNSPSVTPTRTTTPGRPTELPHTGADDPLAALLWWMLYGAFLFLWGSVLLLESERRAS